MIDTVCCDEVLTLYGIDRMRNPPYYDLLAEDMDHHPGCIGKGTYAASASASLLTPAHLHVCVSVVSIPLSRLPENEEIEQWYSFTGNTTSQTFTRAAIRVSLKFTAVAPSSPLHHHPPRHPSFIGHPSSDPSTHVDEAMEDEAASTDLCLPTGLVDYVLLVGPPSSRCPDADKTPTDNVILKRYPPHDRTDFPLPTKIEWFCFPGGYEATLSEEHCRRPPHPKQFTFVLSGGADGLSKCYGSCVWGYEPIAAASLPTRWHPQCLCMLSRVPNLLEFMQDAAIALMWQYMHGVDLAEAYCTHLTTTIPRPIPNLLDVSITLAGLTWRLSMPRRQQRNPTANKHPELPSSLSAADRGRSEPPSSVLLPPLPYSMSVFFDCFPVAVIVQLVILGLCEHRIVVHSTQLSLLCPVTETLKALMYPFRWQHPYVPMLPRILSEYLQAPLPYILGVHSSWLPSLFEGGRPDHLVLVDADRGTITSSFTTHSDTQPPVLPLGLTRDLYTRLKRFKAEAWSPVVEHNIRLSHVEASATADEFWDDEPRAFKTDRGPRKQGRFQSADWFLSHRAALMANPFRPSVSLSCDAADSALMSDVADASAEVHDEAMPGTTKFPDHYMRPSVSRRGPPLNQRVDGGGAAALQRSRQTRENHRLGESFGIEHFNPEDIMFHSLDRPSSNILMGHRTASAVRRDEWTFNSLLASTATWADEDLARERVAATRSSRGGGGKLLTPQPHPSQMHPHRHKNPTTRSHHAAYSLVSESLVCPTVHDRSLPPTPHAARPPAAAAAVVVPPPSSHAAAATTIPTSSCMGRMESGDKRQTAMHAGAARSGAVVEYSIKGAELDKLDALAATLAERLMRVDSMDKDTIRSTLAEVLHATPRRGE
ncbi:hypothetical protein DYB26_010420, partial [Aphanomyces astaci]